jgi:hypothetical protein
MLHAVRFSLQYAVYFIMLPFFGSCIINILHTGVLKFKCKTPVPKGLPMRIMHRDDNKRPGLFGTYERGVIRASTGNVVSASA